MRTKGTGEKAWRRGELRSAIRERLSTIFGGELTEQSVVEKFPLARKRLSKLDHARSVEARDVLYGLCLYAQGASAKSVAEAMKKAHLVGLSARTLESYAKIVSLADPAPKNVEQLLALLAPPDRYANALTRTLVTALEQAAGERSVLPPHLRWRGWALGEIVFFVRTGKWPPRVLCKAIPGRDLDPWNGNDASAWRAVTSSLMAPRCRDVPAAPRPGRREWQKICSLAREAGLPYAMRPLLRSASKEAVRKALLDGEQPQRQMTQNRWGEPEKIWVALDPNETGEPSCVC